jgi:hypothetical protein
MRARLADMFHAWFGCWKVAAEGYDSDGTFRLEVCGRHRWHRGEHR